MTLEEFYLTKDDTGGLFWLNNSAAVYCLVDNDDCVSNIELTRDPKEFLLCVNVKECRLTMLHEDTRVQPYIL